MSEYVLEMEAPEFPPGLDWLNVSPPLRMHDLRGKVVLLGLYTSCCVNCQHVILDLKRLVSKYPSELVVVGVHSPKYPGEQATEAVRAAILRYGINYPVVNDRERQFWQTYQAHTWPTLLLVNPEGRIVGRMCGDDVFEVLDEAIFQLINEFDAKRRVNRTPLESLRPEPRPSSATFLSFPGKVCLDRQYSRLFLADTNHHRIVEVSLPDGKVTTLIGRGEAGLVDGNFEMAQFSSPQGMALDGETLYVADTENHALRRVDLARRIVTTLAGTGRRARSPSSGGEAAATDLNSPWDVVVHEGALYVAMAGSHQLWRMDLALGLIVPFAGDGREARRDGARAEGALAQPSGLATDGHHLYVADSASNAIRRVGLEPDGLLETIAGGDLSLFGDRDGLGREARLQHPLGIAYQEGQLYLADAYNHKLKCVSLATSEVKTLAGTGAAGHRDGDQPQFHKPSGLCIAEKTLYVADTGNHALRKVSLETGRVETLAIAIG